MSRGINKWLGIGNCCADPEIRHMPNGNVVANVTIACNDSYKNKDTGETVDKTEFVRTVFFGKLAEIAGQYLKKGSKVYVEGRLQTRKWQGQDGKDRYTTEVVVDQRGTMQMLDSRASGGTGSLDQGYGQPRPAPAPAPAPAPVPAAPAPQQGGGAPAPQYGGYQGQGEQEFDSDIPF